MSACLFICFVWFRRIGVSDLGSNSKPNTGCTGQCQAAQCQTFGCHAVLAVQASLVYNRLTWNKFVQHEDGMQRQTTKMLVERRPPPGGFSSHAAATRALGRVRRDLLTHIGEHVLPLTRILKAHAMLSESRSTVGASGALHFAVRLAQGPRTCDRVHTTLSLESLRYMRLLHVAVGHNERTGTCQHNTCPMRAKCRACRVATARHAAEPAEQHQQVRQHHRQNGQHHRLPARPLARC